MKRILYCTRSGGADIGGMQTFARTLTNALAAHPACSITTCVHRSGKLLVPFYVLRVFWNALTADVDTVLLGDPVLSPALLLLALLRPGVRRCIIVHGLDLTWRYPGYRTVVSFCLRRAHIVVAISSATGRLALDLGIPADRLRVLPCPAPAIDLPAPIPRNPGQLLLLGRLIPRKGVAWFLEKVLPSLLQQYPHLVVIIAGDGPDRATIGGILAASPHAHAVRFRGAVSESEKVMLLASSTLLLVPNIPIPGDHEGFGLVCLEAGLLGTPVVSARLEGLTDAVIDGETGLFFTPGSPDDAVRVLRAALDRPWSETKIKAAVHTRFSSQVIADRYFHDVV